MLQLDTQKADLDSVSFCSDFLAVKPTDRFIFGINPYALEIAQLVDIAAFIDDFTTEVECQGKPIIRSNEIPADGMVVSSLLGKPLTAKNSLSKLGVRHIDYFAFHTYSGLIDHPVLFWGDGKQDIEENFGEYSQLYSKLSDTTSKNIFQRIVNFRFTSNLKYMEGFSDRQKQQYFEPFFKLNKQDEVFIDIGGFDGETSIEFIRHCPDYKSIYYLEPDQRNMEHSKSVLSHYPNVNFLQYGASNRQGRASFSSNGSVSSIKEGGLQEVQLNTIDNLIKSPVTFIKIDIEGAEIAAIEGAIETITKNHPILAISVYHQTSDLRTIPNLISTIRDDYNIYLRHYTEGVVETIMYFIPQNRNSI